MEKQGILLEMSEIDVSIDLMCRAKAKGIFYDILDDFTLTMYNLRLVNRKYEVDLYHYLIRYWKSRGFDARR